MINTVGLTFQSLLGAIDIENIRINKMKSKQYHTVGTIPKLNIKIVD